MNPEKVGKFIKKLRKDNHLTQKKLADKYGVTYQAVSKWENGINLPEVTLIRQMSKDFNINIEDILDGEFLTKKKNRNKIILIVSIISIAVITLIMGLTIVVKNVSDNKSFSFKTLSTTCNEFNVSGSIAYDNKRSSIYISHITYCGGNDTTIYKKIECSLYEKNNNTNTILSSCKSKGNEVTLEEYLKNVELNIDNYTKTCKYYNNDSFYLEINATDQNNKVITYRIPLELKNNCPK